VLLRVPIVFLLSIKYAPLTYRIVALTNTLYIMVQLPFRRFVCALALACFLALLFFFVFLPVDAPVGVDADATGEAATEDKAADSISSNPRSSVADDLAASLSKLADSDILVASRVLSVTFRSCGMVNSFWG
jgi:hypothetical protein